VENSPEDAGKEWIQCDKCKKWSHVECSNVSGEQVADASFRFYCAACQIFFPNIENRNDKEQST